MNHLTKVSDLSLVDVNDILEKAFLFREKYKKGIRLENVLNGKIITLVFEKPSLRTKMAFESSAFYLGGCPIFLSGKEIFANPSSHHSRESLPDIAKNLERFSDLIVARVYSHNTIKEIVKSVNIPVVNALCDNHHPTQALADLMTIEIYKKDTQNLKVAYIGDGANVSTSLMQICALKGINFSSASPKGYGISNEEIKIGEQLAKTSRASLAFFTNPKDAIEDADVVYTDTFLSMGLEEEREVREEIFKDYIVNSSLMSYAKNDAIFMHCLPAHRGEEVTDEVIDSPNSVVFEQAECRMHVVKALICNLLGVK